MEKDDRKISIGQIFLLGIFFLVVGTFIFSPQKSQGEFNCGDSICDGVDENQDNCCTDCGCAEGSTCTENVCVADPFCGDSSCDAGEDCSSCPGDCPCGAGYTCDGAPAGTCVADPFCGDSSCNGAETTADCCADCGCDVGSTCTENVCVVDPFCGDAVCNGTEIAFDCPGDCYCGDTVCNAADETTADCPADCGSSCGDAVCNGDETTANCVADCGSACNDGTCNGDETTGNCCSDCGCAEHYSCMSENQTCNYVPYCSDGTCDEGETTADCPADCGTSCGDAVCNGDENISGCCTDCGCDAGSSCADNVCTVDAFCGDFSCNGAETTANCADDCGSSCGDAVCNGDETTANCVADCGSSCGDSTCNGTETPADCPGDCYCGNGSCSGGETTADCSEDCGSSCGDMVCNGTETTADCPADCGSSCGDAVCNGSENCSDCPGDCPCGEGYTCDGAGTCLADPVCGDAVCNGAETTADCPTDCGTSCGDAVCNGAETTADCCTDCGCDAGSSCAENVCTVDAFCGDGVVNGDEGCDDSNATSGDGCSNLCQFETPVAPDNFSGVSASTNSILWSWTSGGSSFETGFKIYDGSANLIDTVDADTLSYTETGLTEGSSYTRYVIAYSNGGAQESASSGNVSATTAPTAPSVFYGTADSSTAITWQWTDNSTHEDGYKIYDGSNQLKGTVGASVTSWQETGLTAGQSYTRHVVAYKGSSVSSDSNSDSVTTTTTPTAASGLTGSAASASSITWIWTDNASNETGFKLYNSSGTLIATISADTETYTETGLSKNTAYSRYLKAYNSYGESAATDTASASTNDSAPTAPTLFVGSAVSSTKIDWSWADNSNDETGFRIYDGSGNLITTVGTNISSYTETGLTKNTSYTRYVTAYNGIGASTASSSYAVTTKADAPTSPELSSPATSSLINTLTPTFTFKRSSDTDDGIDNYILILNPGESDEKSITIANISDGGSQKNSYGVVVGASSTISFTLTDSTLLRDGANTWKVRAVDLGANSAESDIHAFIINQKLPVVEKVTFSSAISNDNNEIITTASSGNLVIFLSSSTGLKELKASLRKQIFIFGTSVGTQSVLEKTFVISGKNSVVTLPLSDLRIGKYQLLLNLKDTSGNITDWSRTIRVVTPEEAQGLGGSLALSPADAKRLADEGKVVSRTPLNMRLDELANYGADLRSKQSDSTDQFLERYLTFEQVSNLDTKIAIFSRRLKDSIFNFLGKSGRTLSHFISQPIRHRFAMMSSAAFEASKSGKTNRLELALQTQKYFGVISTPVRVVFQRVGTSVRVAWDVMSGNHEGALKIAEVKIESVGKTQVSISWKTNRVARGKVNYGSSPAYGMELFIDDYTTNHQAVLTGLSAGHKYFFEVLATDLKSQNAFDAFYSFDTPE